MATKKTKAKSKKAAAKAKPAAKKKAATKKAAPKATAAKKVNAKAKSSSASSSSVAAKTKKPATKKTAAKKKGSKVQGTEPTQTVLETQLYQNTSDISTSSEICREVGCDAFGTTSGYCRLHYIKNWKKIKRKEIILKEGKLNRYIEELVAKYPDKYIEAIRNDLANNAEFAKVVNDLDLAEGIDDFEADSDAVDSLIDSIRRDVDDDSDSY